MGDGENTGYLHVFLQEPFSLLFLLLLLLDLLLSLLFKTFLIHQILIVLVKKHFENNVEKEENIGYSGLNLEISVADRIPAK